jgi:hypothetical protein
MRISTDQHTRVKALPYNEYYSPQQIADLLHIDMKEFEKYVDTTDLPLYRGKLRGLIVWRYIDRLYTLQPIECE